MLINIYKLYSLGLLYCILFLLFIPLIFLIFVLLIFFQLENDICEIRRQIKEMKKPENPQDPALKSLSTEILEEKAKDLAEKHKHTREALTCKQNMCEQLEEQSEALTVRIGLLNEITVLINKNM